MPDAPNSQITDEISKAIKQGKLTAQDVYKIVHDAVAHSSKEFEGGKKEVGEVSTEAVRAAIQSLEDGGHDSSDKISAAVHGAFDGVKETHASAMNSIELELDERTAELLEEKDAIAFAMNDTLEEVKEMAKDFSEHIRDEIDHAVADARLRMTDLFGITYSTVQEAVKEAIESEPKPDDTIQKITRDATFSALSEANLTAEQVRKVTKSVLSASVGAIEGANKKVAERTSAAADGVRAGLSAAIEQTREDINKSGRDAKNYTQRELHQINEGVKLAAGVFVETLKIIGQDSSEAARVVLNDMADDASKAGSNLREISVSAANVAADKLKDLGEHTVQSGKRVVSATGHEVAKLGNRMVGIAKGTITGAWQGAKKSLDSKNDETPNKKDSQS